MKESYLLNKKNPFDDLSSDSCSDSQGDSCSKSQDLCSKEASVKLQILDDPAVLENPKQISKKIPGFAKFIQNQSLDKSKGSDNSSRPESGLSTNYPERNSLIENSKPFNTFFNIKGLDHESDEENFIDGMKMKS